MQPLQVWSLLKLDIYTRHRKTQFDVAQHVTVQSSWPVSDSP